MIPFLGAGASLGNRPPGVDWEESASTFLPRGDELSLWLAEIISFPSIEPHDRRDLAKVSSYFAEMSARDRLIERLRGVFRRNDHVPCDIHLFLAELAKSADIARNADAELLDTYEPLKAEEFKPLLIVTTNYDDLTETALRELGCPYDLVVHPTDQKDRGGSVMWWRHGAKEPEWERANNLAIDLDTTTVVYKMHGTVSHAMGELDSYVITEEDYIEFLSLMTSHGAVPQLFTTHFFTRQFLFLGYGLRDWNFRVMLKNLKEKPKSQNGSGKHAEPSAGQGAPAPEVDRERKELKSWAIQKDPLPLEFFLWGARDVAIFDEDINQFVSELRKRSPRLVCHTKLRG